MATRWQLTAVTLCLILAGASLLRADIYRWDNNQVIPGTEGITPGPGVQLDRRDLEYADLHGMDLNEASFEASNLTDALLLGANFINRGITDLHEEIWTTQ